MTAGLDERRRSRRIDAALPVILENASAVTRDTSASGVFFWKRGTFMYGDSIHFSIERNTESGRILQKCRGVVVRTEPRDNGVGVAARITESTTEPFPVHSSGIDFLKSAREQAQRVNRLGNDASASAIETVDRWSLLLRKKALEASEELQGQEVLDWDIPWIADARTPHSGRVRVCSVTVVDLASNESRVPRWSGIPGGAYRGFDRPHFNGEIGARKDAGEARVDDVSEFLSWQNARGGRGIRIDLEACVENGSRDEPALHKKPMTRVVVRVTLLRDDDHHQEPGGNCYEQASYSDPAEAFEAFLALAGESAILVNLG